MGEPNRFSSYLTYPCHGDVGVDSYVYYAVSVPTEEKTTFESQVLLVGCQDQTTIVITPTDSITLPIDAQNDSPEVTIPSNTASHPLILNRAQTLLFVSTNDLTGSKIVSNKPLTVISGHECGFVEYNFCEHLAVQVLPVANWGRQFLLTPFAHRKSGQIYRIVSSEDETNVDCTINNRLTISRRISKAGGATDIFSTSDSFAWLISTKPVLVVQMATGNEGDGIGDPIITLISPTDMFVSNTLFVALDSSMFPKQAISVAVQAGDDFKPFSVRYDDDKLDCEWFKIQDSTGVTKGHGCTFTGVTGGNTHTVLQRSNGKISVLSYGFGSESGYGYLAGMGQARAIREKYYYACSHHKF